ncbi:hypothetical protein GCM10020358_28770 [Amorphoplanes nipponensis]|uniref:PPM-type phosphatase domain-containing protein n=1 Tax=Actinoplanes nipponensis TaxID=135950 RepID=A0A919JJH7_9ACTN|nr:hypothetical protein Ani05nite_39490 [Actinoplanes nipponensis]
MLAVVNAGHPTPLLVRGGVTRSPALTVNRPFGLLRDRPFRTARVDLRPGDRLVLLTDGMLERGAAALDLPTHLADLRELHPRELVRVLGDLILEVAGPTARCPTTPACWSSTGTAATATPATPAPAPTSTGPAAPRPHGSATPAVTIGDRPKLVTI